MVTTISPELLAAPPGQKEQKIEDDSKEHSVQAPVVTVTIMDAVIDMSPKFVPVI